MFHDVINVKHARKAAEQGVDGLILVCAGAGGHAGTLSPFALLREVKQWFKGTILLSGAISDGCEHCLGARARRRPRLYGHALHRHRGGECRPGLQEGADRATPRDDIVYSNLFTGVHGNYLGAVDRGRGSRSRTTCRPPTSRR